MESGIAVDSKSATRRFPFRIRCRSAPTLERVSADCVPSVRLSLTDGCQSVRRTI